MEFNNNINTYKNTNLSNSIYFKDSNNENIKVSDIKKDETKYNDNEDDISVVLNKEINELKAEYSKPINARRFQVNFLYTFLFLFKI